MSNLLKVPRKIQQIYSNLLYQHENPWKLEILNDFID